VFLQNYLGAAGFPQSWSLCVEEHFYLALPVVAFLIGRLFGRESFAIILPIAFFVPLVLRVGTFLALGSMPFEWYRMTHFHCEGLVAGVWLAYLFVDRRRIFDALKRPSAWLLPLTPIMLILAPKWHGHESDVNFYIVGFTFEALAFAALVRFLYDFQWQPQRWAGQIIQRSIRGLALCSYSIYLTHLALLTLFGSLGFIMALPHVLGTLARFVGTLLLGAAFYLLVERPAIVTRDRFLGSERS
jgi:peptidoglycan/LPS O-acetylase OafA/YrhL